MRSKTATATTATATTAATAFGFSSFQSCSSRVVLRSSFRNCWIRLFTTRITFLWPSQQCQSTRTWRAKHRITAKCKKRQKHASM